MLGVIGVVIALPMLLLKDRRDDHGETGQAERGAPFVQADAHGARSRCAAIRSVLLTIVGFVLVHMVFAGLAFAQLWLVRERGFDAAGIARQIGGLQIVFGMLGSVVGGVLSDRLARRIPGGHAGFLVLLVALCGPLMIAYRFAPAGSALFYVGMCAGLLPAAGHLRPGAGADPGSHADPDALHRHRLHDAADQRLRDRDRQRAGRRGRATA